MALKLSLKPGEKFAINGAVIVNGDRRADIIVQNKVRLLRERDIMQAEEANSPAKRVYLPLMMMYLEPETEAEMRPEFAARLEEITNAVSDPKALDWCLQIGAHAANSEFYKAMTACRHLIEFEEERLSHVA